MSQMNYDLSLLSRKYPPHSEESNTDTATPDGLRISIFCTRIHDRLLVPLCAADQPPAPSQSVVLWTIDIDVEHYINRVRLERSTVSA